MFYFATIEGNLNATAEEFGVENIEELEIDCNGATALVTLTDDQEDELLHEEWIEIKSNAGLITIEMP